MKWRTLKIPGATYTADSTIISIPTQQPVLAVVTAVDMGAITTSTNVDLVWKALSGDELTSKAYHDISLTSTTDIVDWLPTTADIANPASALFPLTFGGPLNLTIDATWGGGSVVITNIWVCLLEAD